MRIESSVVLRAVASDFPSENRIRHASRCVPYHAQCFQLETIRNVYFGSGSRTPEVYSVSPDGFDHCFIYEIFLARSEV
jgi:hypothetical protein